MGTPDLDMFDTMVKDKRQQKHTCGRAKKNKKQKRHSQWSFDEKV